MSSILAALRRHLPGGRSRAVRSAFLHGYHAGQHDAGGECVPLGERCELLERIKVTPDVLRTV